MKQISLGLNLSTKKTRKREFLEEMDRVVPWDVLVQIVAPYYTKAKTGRPAFAIRYRDRVYAYLNACAHVPVELDLVEGDLFDLSGQYLVCAMHGAYYHPESGVCLGCGRPLDVPPIRPQPPESEAAATTPPDAAQDASTLPRP